MSGLAPMLATIVGFAVTAISGWFLIPYLRKLKFGQTILDIGPKWHKSKEGTPTMGGIMFILGTIISVIAGCVTLYFVAPDLFAKGFGDTMSFVRFLAGLLMALCMAFIGFMDDYIKVAKKRNLGLTARQKTFLQLLVAAAYLVTLYFSGMTFTKVPFLQTVDINSGWGLLFWPVALMFIYGFTNAVNLTDGVDGLASGVTVVVSLCFMLAAGMLKLPATNLMASALVGSCIGFLIWNFHPARVFMGDTGSMFLGGMVVALAFGIDRPVLLLLAGVLYLLEALSVVIQVVYYKKTHKRLFKMTPIHHHFELSGWSEEKIVIRFSLVTVIGCLIALAAIFWNW